MKKLLLTLLVSSTLIAPISAQAEDDSDGLCNTKPGRCRSGELTQEQTLNSLFLADKIAATIKKLEEDERRNGRDFKVAIIGRMGTNLKGFKLMKDTDSKGRPRDIHQLVSSLKVGQEKFEEYERRGSRNRYRSPEDLDYSKVRDATQENKIMQYSHVGIILKNHRNSEPDKGYWTIMHLLYKCEDNRSFVFEEGIGAFFMDDMKDYKAEILVPSQDIQDKIEDLLLKKKHVYRWLNPRYNAAATPDDLSEQNSNQWVLEVLAAVQSNVGDITSREEANQVLEQTDYRTSIIKPKGLYSLISFPGATKILPSTVCLARQPYFKRYGIAHIVSALSLREYMQRREQLLLRSEVILTEKEQFEKPRPERDNRRLGPRRN